MKQKTNNWTSICIGDNWWVDISALWCFGLHIYVTKSLYILVVDGGYGHMCLGYSEPTGHIGPFTLNY
jgi:hypothetical protein